MKKYRIKKYGDGCFVIQERFLFFLWKNMKSTYGGNQIMWHSSELKARQEIYDLENSQ